MRRDVTTEKREGRGAHVQGSKELAAAIRFARVPEKLPPIHPGEVLAEALREAGVSASSAAIAMGLPPNTLTRIMKGQRNVTGPIALRIARYFGTRGSENRTRSSSS